MKMVNGDDNKVIKQEQEQQNGSDNFRKWVVFISAYFIVAVDVGIFYMMGKLFVTIKDTFNSSRAETALVQSTTLGMALGSGIVCGAIIHKFGPRIAGLFGAFLAFIGLSVSFFATSVTFLVLSLGVCMAIGISILFICTSTVVGTFFTGNSRLMALSVLSTGSGVGGMMYPYLIGYLSDMFGFRGTLLIVGGLVLNSTACALVWKLPARNVEKSKKNMDLKSIDHIINDNNLKNITQPVKHSFIQDSYSYTNKSFDGLQDEKESIPQVFIVTEKSIETEKPSTMSIIIETSGHKDRTMWQSFKYLLKNKKYVAFAFGMGLVYPSIGIFFIFIVDIFIDKGHSESNGSFGLFLINVFSILGRILPGLLMQIPCVSTLSVPILASLIGIAGMVSILFVHSLSLLYVVCSIIGLSLGIIVTAFSVTTVELVGRDNLPNAMGVVFTINGIGYAIAGPVSGFIRDQTGSYVIVFVSAASAILLGCFMFIIAQCVNQHVKKKGNPAPPILYATKL